MLTATTKSLLSPIVDAISQLVVITAEAELSQSPIPDLREVAKLVADHVYSLSDIGIGLIDPATFSFETRGHVDVSKLVEGLLTACSEVKSAGDMLIDVSNILAADPLSASGRKQLVEATKEILQGTQSILNIYDESEVQKTLIVANGIMDHMNLFTKSLDQYTREEDIVDDGVLVKSITDQTKFFAQQSVYLYQLVLARIPEILSPFIQRVLKHHLSCLDKSSVGVVSALRLLMTVNTQLKSSAYNMVISQLYTHKISCQNIAKYVIIEDLAESNSIDSADSDLDNPLNVNKNESIKIEPTLQAIRDVTEQLRMAERDDSKFLDISGKSINTISDFQTKLISTFHNNKCLPQVLETLGYLSEAITESAEPLDSSLRPLHASRIQGLGDHLNRQVDSGVSNAQITAIGSAIANLEKVKSTAILLEGFNNNPNDEFDSLIKRLYIETNETEESLKTIGLNGLDNKFRQDSQLVISAAKAYSSVSQSPESEVQISSVESAKAYLGLVLTCCKNGITDIIDEISKKGPSDTVVLGLGLLTTPLFCVLSPTPAHTLHLAHSVTDKQAVASILLDVESINQQMQAYSSGPEIQSQNKLNETMNSLTSKLRTVGMEDHAHILESYTEAINKNNDNECTAGASTIKNIPTGTLHQISDSVKSVHDHVLRDQLYKELDSDFVNMKAAAKSIPDLYDNCPNQIQLTEFSDLADKICEKLVQIGLDKGSAKIQDSKDLVVNASATKQNSKIIGQELLKFQAHICDANSNYETAKVLIDMGLALDQIDCVHNGVLELKNTSSSNAEVMRKQSDQIQQLSVSATHNLKRIGAATNAIQLRSATKNLASAIDELNIASPTTEERACLAAAAQKCMKAATDSKTKAIEHTYKLMTKNKASEIGNLKYNASKLYEAVAIGNKHKIDTCVQELVYASELAIQNLDGLQVDGNIKESLQNGCNALALCINQECPEMPNQYSNASQNQLYLEIDKYKSVVDQATRDISACSPSSVIMQSIASKGVLASQIFMKSNMFHKTTKRTTQLPLGIQDLANSISSFVNAVRHEIGNTDNSSKKAALEDMLEKIPTYSATVYDPQQVSAIQQFVADSVKVTTNESIQINPVLSIPTDLIVSANPKPKPRQHRCLNSESEGENTPILNSLVDQTSPNNDIHTSESPTPDEQEDQQVNVIHEPQPVLLSENEAKHNPIKAIAQELLVEASKWSIEENDLISTVKKLSAELNQLSQAYKSCYSDANHKLNLFNSSKQISSLSTILQSYVHELSNACQDRRLKVDLLASANRLPTLSQQLKILTSVRASSTSGNYDSEKQLITCAHNLLSIVKEILCKSEIASIRATPQYLKNGGFVFKRNVYRPKSYQQSGSSMKLNKNHSIDQNPKPSSTHSSIESTRKGVVKLDLNKSDGGNAVAQTVAVNTKPKGKYCRHLGQ